MIRLGTLPPALFRDEAEKIWNAKFLWEYGTDADGNPFPLFIKVFGVTTSAVYQYFAVPFVAIGGVNEWTTRLPAACIGTLTVLITGIFGRLIGGPVVGFFSMMFLAFSPWHIHFSRWAQQGIFVPLFLVLGMTGLALFLQKKNDNQISLLQKSGLVVAACSASLAMYSYEVARLFVPLLGVLLCIVWRKELLRQYKLSLVALAAGLILLLPVIYLIVYHSESAQARFNFLSIAGQSNGPSDFLAKFFGNYFAHFSPTFLLLKGDAELRHSAGVGVLSVFEFIAALGGILYLIKTKNPWAVVLIGWILLAPIPASLTRVGIPHALRTITILPAWQMLAAFGVYAAGSQMKISTLRNRYMLCCLGIVIGAMPYLNSYFGSYAGRSAFDWQYGLKESLNFIESYSERTPTKIYFHNIVGAEYLLPVYKNFTASEYRNLMENKSDKYNLLPFQLSGRPAPTVPNEPAVFISPLGYYWGESLRFVPIHGPDGDSFVPVLGLYINDAFYRLITEKAALNEQ